MLEVLRRTSENVFVPLSIGGGIRPFTDAEGRANSALVVAAEYFRSGADKVSIGSDAVEAVERYLARGHQDGSTAIEQIAEVSGNQAVVISVDPRRVYVQDPAQTRHLCLPAPEPETGDRPGWTGSGCRRGRWGGPGERAVSRQGTGSRPPPPVPRRPPRATPWRRWHSPGFPGCPSRWRRPGWMNRRRPGPVRCSARSARGLRNAA